MAIDVLQAWWDLRSGMGGDRDNDNERDNDDGRGDNRQRWQRTAVANPLDAQDGGGFGQMAVYCGCADTLAMSM
jgi:hypothetical protein